MRALRGPAAGRLTFLALLFGCSGVTEVSTADLAQAVARDGVPFDGPAIPSAVVDRLAAHKLILVGETHWLREHRVFMAELVRKLHARGFRQILVEWPQMVDWRLADYVNDGGLVAGWQPGETFGGSIATAIRDFNRTLPDEEHVQVRAIDINLADYGGASSFLGLFRELTDQLPGAPPVRAFLERAYDSPEQQRRTLESLRDDLSADRAALVASWGQDRYDIVAEMVEVELASAGIRALYGDRYDVAARMREDVIKRLADLRLQGYAHGTIINVGANHAQKSRLKGTDQQWLGDYLVNESRAVGGSVIVVGVTAARIEPEPGATARFDVLDASPRNEVFRIITETWPQRNVFLPLDDPLFGRGGVPMNYEGSIYRGAPAQVYDAFLQYGLAHYIPIR